MCRCACERGWRQWRRTACRVCVCKRGGVCVPGDGCEFATLCGVHVSLDGDGTAWCVCVCCVCVTGVPWQATLCCWSGCGRGCTRMMRTRATSGRTGSVLVRDWTGAHVHLPPVASCLFSGCGVARRCRACVSLGTMLWQRHGSEGVCVFAARWVAPFRHTQASKGMTRRPTSVARGTWVYSTWCALWSLVWSQCSRYGVCTIHGRTCIGLE
jgi:hypothetical protein